MAGYHGRRSLRAAGRALLDPELVERPRPSLPAPIECPGLPEQAELLERQIARDFSKLDALDLDDPDSAVLASLSPTDLPVPITRRALRFVRFFGQHPVGREAFRKRFRRAGRHRAAIEHELREAGLPEDLLWLAAVESGFDPKAVSPAGAGGLWQLMPETGALYGLEQSAWLDERLSLTRATTAAVTHLRDLYERLESWDLALAAYNMGYDGVLRALSSAVERTSARGDMPPRPLGFAELAQERLIPQETADYVPKITALAIVAANLERFDLDDLELAEPLRLAELAVPENTRLQLIARAAGISTAELREHNPQLLRDRTPPTGGDYPVALPADRWDHARAALPAYLDHEVLELESTIALPTMPAHLRIDEDHGPVLPQVGAAGLRRPPHLGTNRLPAFPVPGRDGAEQSARPTVLAAFDAALPKHLDGLEVGYKARGAHRIDPFGLLGKPSRAESPTTVVDPELRRHLAFLEGGSRTSARPDPFSSERLAGGIVLRMRTESALPRVAITVRVAAALPNGRASAEPSVELRHSEGEIRYSDLVARKNLDVGLAIAAGRLALLLGQAEHQPLGALRFELGRVRRHDLGKLPYGKAWLALGEALFPEGHPHHGRLMGPDAPTSQVLRNRLLLASLAEERRPQRASITLVGDFEPAQARSQLQQALAALGPRLSSPRAGALLLPEPTRLLVHTDGAEPRLLLGWVAPAAGSPVDAALRVALHILAGRKESRLGRELVKGGMAASARGFVDPDWQASAVVLELVPQKDQGVDELQARVQHIIDGLASEGPTPVELAYAQAILDYRLRKRLERATAVATADSAERTLGERIVETLRPGLLQQWLDQTEAVSERAVRRAVRQHLGAAHRVAVLALPDEQMALLR